MSTDVHSVIISYLRVSVLKKDLLEDFYCNINKITNKNKIYNTNNNSKMAP